jgi:hypothetical protein
MIVQFVSEGCGCGCGLGLDSDWIDQRNSTRQREEARHEEPNAREQEHGSFERRGRVKYADTHTRARESSESLQRKVIGCFKHKSSFPMAILNESKKYSMYKLERSRGDIRYSSFTHE